MKERPILFSGQMVLAILEGRKTQTRRVVKQVPRFQHCGKDIMDWGLSDCFTDETGRHWLDIQTDVDDNSHTEIGCPYGKPGDRFYVKEKHKYYDWTEDGEPFIQYAADDAVRLCQVDSEEWGEKITEIWAKLSAIKNYLIKNRACNQKWRPSIHMPRWASRITLEIVAVRVERLQDISEDDAQEEGIIEERVIVSCNCNGGVHQEVMGDRYGFNGCDSDYEFASDAFCALWQSINGPGSWEKNPFVWVIEFKRVNG